MADIEGAAGVLEGLARYLARSEVALYNPSGVYAKGERGISFNRVPETPLEVVSLALYAPEYTKLSPTAVRELAAVSVQIKCRLVGSPLVGVQFLDTLRALIDRRRMQLGAVIAHGEFLSYADLGAGAQATSISSTNWRLTGLHAL